MSAGVGIPHRIALFVLTLLLARSLPCAASLRDTGQWETTYPEC